MSPPLRRLFALVTLLGLLIGSSGWDARGCALPVSTHAGHSGLASVSSVSSIGARSSCASQVRAGDEACTKRNDGVTPSHCDRNGIPRNASNSGGCVSPAHCATWSPLAPSAPVVSTLASVSAPRALRDASMPLGPETEPDFPPPRA